MFAVNPDAQHRGDNLTHEMSFDGLQEDLHVCSDVFLMFRVCIIACFIRGQHVDS